MSVWKRVVEAYETKGPTRTLHIAFLEFAEEIEYEPLKLNRWTDLMSAAKQCSSMTYHPQFTPEARRKLGFNDPKVMPQSAYPFGGSLAQQQAKDVQALQDAVGNMKCAIDSYLERAQ